MSHNQPWPLIFRTTKFMLVSLVLTSGTCKINNDENNTRNNINSGLKSKHLKVQPKEEPQVVIIKKEPQVWYISMTFHQEKLIGTYNFRLPKVYT